MTALASVRRGTALTERELAALSLAADGLTDAQIGTRLFVSAPTVKTHLRAAYIRLGAVNRPNAVYLAIKAGVLT